MIPVEGQKVVNLSPDWVAGYFRIRWQLSSGLGGSFRPEYTLPIKLGFLTNFVTQILRKNKGYQN